MARAMEGSDLGLLQPLSAACPPVTPHNTAVTPCIPPITRLDSEHVNQAPQLTIPQYPPSQKIQPASYQTTATATVSSLLHTKPVTDPPSDRLTHYYHGGRRSSGVHPLVNGQAYHSQTSSSPSSDGGDPSSFWRLSTPDVEAMLDEAIMPAQDISCHHPYQVMPDYQMPQAMSAQMSQPQDVLQDNTGSMFMNDNISQELVGEPGPIIEEGTATLPHLQVPVDSKAHVTAPKLSITQSTESLDRPVSVNTVGSSSNSEGSKLGASSHRTHLSPTSGLPPSYSSSPSLAGQNHLTTRHLPDRPVSYIDLLQTPYAQQVALASNMDNSFLRSAVGTNASLLSSAKTLDMYRANAKKSQNPSIQYEFALFLIQTAVDLPPTSKNGEPTRPGLVREARTILQRLADRSYPFAQYYLADGWFSGLFHNGKPDFDRAFPLFVAASKRGHAESGYRAALCYEFGWGCRTDYAKAAKFYESAAAKNHPGAATRLGLACVHNGLGITGQYRQGVKWLKRAAESADKQYNAAPFELARLHENGFGDDIFKDPQYAAQLYTQSADLGHPESNLFMGKAYEHGLLGCPQDAGLSIHFYTNAAESDNPEAMMALCAWYLFGAEPVLEQNENEAFEWAKRAAEMGKCIHEKHWMIMIAYMWIEYSKAEYAIGYFKEAGIGCSQDSLEANNWYWRAAQQGEERAKQRIASINFAVSGGATNISSKSKLGNSSKLIKKGLFAKLGR